MTTKSKTSVRDDGAPLREFRGQVNKVIYFSETRDIFNWNYFKEKSDNFPISGNFPWKS